MGGGSADMLTAIDDLGFYNCFDQIYACSSGAINAAYYLAAELGIRLRSTSRI